MYAIITAGASQHKVTEGETLQIDLIAGKKKGDKLVFDKVLFVENNGTHTIGQPTVAGAKVEAVVVDNGTDGEGKKGVKIFTATDNAGPGGSWLNIEVDNKFGGIDGGDPDAWEQAFRATRPA